ncbi:MAG: triphosphoribosyl-dephospho-CoA synthase [Planctomycetota bacterium]|nr:triphosphoribosyl-dephospho-CoA synthase [Planctomycetota bacterium]MDA0919450.1 triphosphoribosyl-dephospho-CoA synthase [Planctomycetota bacterium]
MTDGSVIPELKPGYRVSAANLQECVHRACLLEATSRKPGNVHPGESFEHLAYEDFVASAEAIAPVLARAAEVGVGRSVLEAVKATRAVCEYNTNLGIILLLAPLAAVPVDTPLPEGIAGVLSELTQEDAGYVFEAIRLAQPRGLGNADTEDVATSAPTGTLTEVMTLASDRDSVARQYASDFETVLKFGVSSLMASGRFNEDWEQAIVHLHLSLLARDGDTDIARKCNSIDAREVVRRATSVLRAGWPMAMEGRMRIREFDRWLRAKGSLRNPGTTADLVTAGVFAVLRDQRALMPSLEEIQIRAEENRTAQQ